MNKPNDANPDRKLFKLLGNPNQTTVLERGRLSKKKNTLAKYSLASGRRDGVPQVVLVGPERRDRASSR